MVLVGWMGLVLDIESLWNPTSGAFLFNENEYGWLFFTNSKFYNYKLSEWLPYLRMTVVHFSGSVGYVGY